MPVAVCLGGDPSYTFAATAPLPDGLDEVLFAGFARKKSVELVKCETCDLEVPADVDFVLEGYVQPGELRGEGPFGDHTGFYTAVDPYPVFHHPPKRGDLSGNDCRCSTHGRLLHG
jgi:4-hydroxy-3-polyprenylbenzoate decarboxylase